VNPYTLAIDIGGSHLKTSVLDADGRLAAEPVHVVTPRAATPEWLLRTLRRIVRDLPSFDRISAGFPGAVRDGVVLTAPHLGTREWHGFPLAAALAERMGVPARVLNDAEVQGFGVITGRGLECVLTFGTGLGSSLFWHGRLTPHLELSQHPLHNGKTYDEYLGEAAFRAKGRRKWNRHVARAIDVVRTLVNFDRLYLGGGNAANIDLELPKDIKIVANVAGITGGIELWRPGNDDLFSDLVGRPRRAAATSPKGRGRVARRR
jgi:polyphosphate glucokinase